MTHLLVDMVGEKSSKAGLKTTAGPAVCQDPAGPLHLSQKSYAHLHWEILHLFVSHYPLPLSRAGLGGMGWDLIFFAKVGSIFPRPSSLQTALAWLLSAMALFFRA